MDNSDLLVYNFEGNDNYNNGIPVGNSHLGMMVLGNVLEEKLYLNENTFWLGQENVLRHNRDFYKNYKKTQNLLLQDKVVEANEMALSLLPQLKDGASYTSGGVLNLNFHTKDNFSNYKRYLNLSEGYVGVEYDILNNHIKRIYQASYSNDALMVHIESLYEISLSASLDIEHFNHNIKTYKNMNLLLLSVKLPFLTYEIAIRAFANQIKFIGNKILLTGKEINIYIIGATSNFRSNPRLYLYKQANLLDLAPSYKEFHDNAIKDYQKLYKRQSFHTNVDIIDKYYNFSRYLIISGSRMNVPLNSCGLWTKEYNSNINYNLNINLQMNYYNTLESNLKECFEPLLNLIKKMNKKGYMVARNLYHAQGSVSHNATDYYGDSSMFGDSLSSAIWPLGQVVMCIFIFKYYFFTNDINFLKKYYNILISNANFLQSILVKDKDNKYVISPSVSPTNSFLVNKSVCSVACGTTCDDEIIYEFFYDLIIVNRILGHEENDNKDYLDIILNLHHLVISSQNMVIEYHDDYKINELNHEHLSHLYQITNPFLYPTNVVREASYNTIMDKIKRNSDKTGWSNCYMTLLLIHLGKGKDAYKEMAKFIKKFCSKTLLNIENNVFKIDGNIGVARCIRDMFLIDSNNKLILCQAVPEECNTYTLKGFPVSNNLICDLFKTKDDFVLTVTSDKEKDFVINYNKKDYFLHLKNGKNRFDLNEILDI